jgi:hypothetical protein
MDEHLTIAQNVLFGVPSSNLPLRGQIIRLWPSP